MTRQKQKLTLCSTNPVKSRHWSCLLPLYWLSTIGFHNIAFNFLQLIQCKSRNQAIQPWLRQIGFLFFSGYAVWINFEFHSDGIFWDFTQSGFGTRLNKAKWLQSNCRQMQGCATLVRAKFRKKVFKAKQSAVKKVSSSPAKTRQDKKKLQGSFANCRQWTAVKILTGKRDNS